MDQRPRLSPATPGTPHRPGLAARLRGGGRVGGARRLSTGPWKASTRPAQARSRARRTAARLRFRSAMAKAPGKWRMRRRYLARARALGRAAPRRAGRGERGHGNARRREGRLSRARLCTRARARRTRTPSPSRTLRLSRARVPPWAARRRSHRPRWAKALRVEGPARGDGALGPFGYARGTSPPRAPRTFRGACTCASGASKPGASACPSTSPTRSSPEGRRRPGALPALGSLLAVGGPRLGRAAQLRARAAGHVLPFRVVAALGLAGAVVVRVAAVVLARLGDALAHLLTGEALTEIEMVLRRGLESARRGPMSFTYGAECPGNAFWGPDGAVEQPL